MAEDKKGFILYADQKELFDQLPNEKAGELIKFIFGYVNDEDPKTDDLLIKLAFTPIKQQFKRDLKKWESKREQRSNAGKASAEARRLKKEQRSTNITNVNEAQQRSTSPTVNGNVNVTVNDNVKGIKEGYSTQVLQTYEAVLPFFNEKDLPKDKKQKSSWLETIEKLNRLDKYSFDKIIEITKKGRTDNFWKKNFFTIHKLRKNNKDGIKHSRIFEEINDSKSKNQTVGTSVSKKETSKDFGFS